MDQATNRLAGAIQADDAQQGKCEKCKSLLNDRIDQLNQFRWKTVGIAVAAMAVPGLATFILLLVKYAEGGLR